MRAATEPLFCIQCHPPSSGFSNRRLSMNAIDRVSRVGGWIEGWGKREMEGKRGGEGGCMLRSDGTLETVEP